MWSIKRCTPKRLLACRFLTSHFCAIHESLPLSLITVTAYHLLVAGERQLHFCQMYCDGLSAGPLQIMNMIPSCMSACRAHAPTGCVVVADISYHISGSSSCLLILPVCVLRSLRLLILDTARPRSLLKRLNVVDCFGELINPLCIVALVTLVFPCVKHYTNYDVFCVRLLQLTDMWHVTAMFSHR